MRSANFATTGPSISALHLHFIDTGRFSLQFYTRDSKQCQKGAGCTAASAAGLDARRPTLKAGKALIFGISRHTRRQSVRDRHTRNLEGEPIEEPVAVPAA